MSSTGEQAGEIKTKYHPVHRIWPQKARKAIWYLMGLELAGLIPVLVIFGISQPDLYRSDMWRIGWENKLNSNPNRVLLAYANYKPLPEVALVWTKTLTDFNVAISIISLFFLLAKLIANIMKVWFPIVATFANFILMGLYTVSVYGQIGPDYTDSRYPAPAAWYFRYGCDMAKPYGAYKSCQIAQSSLGLAFYMLVIYLVNLGFCAWAMWPNPINDVEEEEEDEFKPPRDWEMQSMKSPMMTNVTAMPYTPRTQAFHTLNRQLPLRQQSGPRFA